MPLEIQMSKGILYDATMCIGCRQCEKACAERNKLAYDDNIAAEEFISERKLTTIMTRGDKFMRRLCMACLDPACASVCPVGALKKTALGPVTYDESKCMGCRYCMMACPFGVPKYEWSKLIPRVRKCDTCSDRVAAGRPTACAEACPTGATICGERDALIAEARRRLAEKPHDYYQHIYGLKEVGGTSVLYLAAVPFEQIGLRARLPQEPLPALTWRVLSAVPDVVSVGSVLLGGVWWITNRRDAVARAEGDKNR